MVSLSSSSNPKCLSFPSPCYCSFIVLSVLMPCGTSVSFNFTSFHDHGGDIVVQGDAFVSPKDGQVELTTNDIDKSPLNSSGRAMYSSLMPLWDKASGKAADFNTHFSFTINSLYDTHHGDGLAFFLADPAALPNMDASKGGGLGILRGDQLLNSNLFRFVAVEFDTFPNEFDPSYEHVGIDINSVKSSAHVGWCNSVLQGKENEVWISYNSVAHNLSIAFTGYCNDSDTKFQQYLDYQLDLASLLPEKVAFGFAAATGVEAEFHTIKFWHFNSSLVLVPNSEPPLNSESQVPVSSPSRHHVNIVFLVGLPIGIVTFLGLIGIIVWFLLVQRRRNGKAEDVAHQSGDGVQIDVTDQFYSITELNSSSTATQEIGQPSVGGPGEEEGVLGEVKAGEIDEDGPSYRHEAKNGEMDEAEPSNRHRSEGTDQRSMDDEFENYTGPKKYSYEELSRATNGFNLQEGLGRGGFGSVYKGVLGKR